MRVEKSGVDLTTIEKCAIAGEGIQRGRRSFKAK
jgi:hypothetical protein